MPILWRRISINSSVEAANRLRPSISTSPEVGSFKRVMARIKVDLPDPDKPMITRISFSITSKDTSRTAPMYCSAAKAAASGRIWCFFKKPSGSGPNTFHRWRQTIFGSAFSIQHPSHTQRYKTEWAAQGGPPVRTNISSSRLSRWPGCLQSTSWLRLPASCHRHRPTLQQRQSGHW